MKDSKTKNNSRKDINSLNTESILNAPSNPSSNRTKGILYPVIPHFYKGTISGDKIKSKKSLRKNNKKSTKD